jgi:SAM-dependent methyltransferase
MRGNKWDQDSFFEHGTVYVAQIVEKVKALGAEAGRGRVLDFGCGPGRCTQAFADHFDRVDGVDVAAPMIELAKQLNRHGDRCRYHVNTVDDLSLFGDETFDVVHSTITLIHIPKASALRYIREFARVTKPGGFIVFDFAARSKNRLRGFILRWMPRRLARSLFRFKHGVDSFMDVNPIPGPQVKESLASAGSDVIEIQEAPSEGVKYLTYRYFAKKRPERSRADGLAGS